MLIACGMYTDLRELYTGIQVAGPKLTPDSINQGYHAIPKTPSNNSTVPSCFYLDSDYTCTKDETMVWWDPNGFDPDGNHGCWRLAENGKRYLLGNWSPGNYNTFISTSNVCNDFQ